MSAVETPRTLPNDNDDDHLWSALNYERWDACRELLKDDRAARVTARYVSPRGGWTTLHVACGKNAPVDVVEAILERGPDDLVERRDDYGRIALHWACGCASEHVVESVLRRAPRSIAVADVVGLLPLEIAIYHCRAPSLIQTLVTAHPAAVRDEDLVLWRLFWPVGSTRRQTLLDRSINLWRAQLESAWPDLSALPAHDVNRVDERMSGVERLKATFYSLLAASWNVADEDSVRAGFLLRAAIRYGDAIPVIIMRLLLRTATGKEITGRDQAGNFLLHVACAKSTNEPNQGDVSQSNETTA